MATMDNKYLSVPEDLLRKYDRPGPRYTSYPTVPVWTEDFGAADYRRHLEQYKQSDRPISVYVHIPFCEERCTYCGCNVVIAQRQDTVLRYLEYLYREIDKTVQQLGGKRRLLQLHWGGGTPTFLTIPQIDELYTKLQNAFEFDPKAEIGIEVDPRVTSDEQLRHLRKIGFNRLSMGVQDLTPDVQEAIGRGQTVKQTERMYTVGRELGFLGINMDLVYGLPRQTVADYERAIEQVVAWRPDRLAVYSYAHVPWVKPHQMQISEADLPKGPDKFALFATAIRKLIEAGYAPIGMDHFALPQDELAQGLENGHLHRNFMGYTVSLSRDMLGFGVSSIGEVGGCFAQNDSRLGGYYRRLDDTGYAVYRGWSLTQDDQIRRETILSIMCRMHLDLNAIGKQFEMDATEYFEREMSLLDEFVEDELIELTDHGFRVTDMGRHFVRNIAMVFDAHLAGLTEKATVKKPIFSRTV